MALKARFVSKPFSQVRKAGMRWRGVLRSSVLATFWSSKGPRDGRLPTFTPTTEATRPGNPRTEEMTRFIDDLETRFETRSPT
ncbi:MAG: hypothetical protein AAGF76_09915, partial [Pseudomonadota bacterium]